MGPSVEDKWVVSRASTHNTAVHGLFMAGFFFWGGGLLLTLHNVFIYFHPRLNKVSPEIY